MNGCMKGWCGGACMCAGGGACMCAGGGWVGGGRLWRFRVELLVTLKLLLPLRCDGAAAITVTKCSKANNVRQDKQTSLKKKKQNKNKSKSVYLFYVKRCWSSTHETWTYLLRQLRPPENSGKPSVFAEFSARSSFRDEFDSSSECWPRRATGRRTAAGLFRNEEPWNMLHILLWRLHAYQRVLHCCSRTVPECLRFPGRRGSTTQQSRPPTASRLQ